jgi:hypothetical protein
MTIKNPPNNRKFPILGRLAAARLERAALTVLLCAAIVMCAAGCGVIGGVYGAIIDPMIPPPTIKSEHDMTQKHVLVWVDDPMNSSSAPQLKRELTEQLIQQLTSHKAVKSAVEYSRIIEFCYSHPEYAQTSMQRIGEFFQAEEILQVTIVDFTLRYETQEEFYQPRISGNMKVIDASTGVRVWPITANQNTFDLISKLIPGKDEHLEETLVRNLCEVTSLQIAQYFYDHPGPKK